MAGNGPEVGRVSVKVMPDTTGFKDRLRRQLQGVDKDIEVGVRTKNGAVEKLKAEVARATKNIPDAAVNVDFTADKRTVDAALAGLRQKIIDIPVDPKMRAGWHEEIQAEIDAAKALTLDADLAAEGVRQHLAATLAELQVAAALNPVEIPVQLDRKTLRNLAGTALSGVGDTLTGAMSGLSGFASSGMSKLAGVAPMLLAIAAAATLVAPALALVSGSLTLIPAAVAGFATPIAAVILGLDGIKKAAENAGLTSTSTGKRGATKTTIGEQLKELREAVSGTFTDKLTPVFEKLNGVVTQLKTPFQTVAAGLSDMADGFVTAVTSQKGMDQIKGTISNIGDGLRNAAPGIRDFTSAILTLASEVSTRFPGLGTAFSGLGKDFLGWVNKFTTKDAVTGLSDLDTTLQSLKGTWDQISGLGGDMLKQGFEWISDPNFGTSMTEFFGSVRDFVTNTLPSLGAGFQDFADIMDGIRPAFKFIGDGVEGMKNMVKVMQGNPEGLKGFWDMLTGDPEQSAADGRKLGAALKEGVDAGIKAGNAIGVEDVIPPDLGGAISAQIATQINASAEEQKQALRSAFTAGGVDGAVSAQLTQQVTAAVAGAKQAMVGLGPELQAQIDTATAPLGNIGGLIGAAFNTVQTTVSGAMTGVIQTAATGAQQIVTAFTAAFAQIPAATAGAFGTLVTSIQGPMTQAVQAVVNGGVLIQAELQSWPGKFQAAVGELSGALVQAGAQLVQGLVNGINANKGAAVAAAAQMASEVAAASKAELGVRSPSRVFTEIGDNVGQGFINGMEGQRQAVADKAAELAAGVKDATQSGLAGQYDSMFQKTAGIPKDFAMANANQFMSDMGIGGGAITGGLMAGIDMGTNFIFNVSGIGEAMQLKDRAVNKQAVGVVGR